MLNLPSSTRVGKIIAKDKFYTHGKITTIVKQAFIDEVDHIVWANKIAPTTMNITAKKWAELQVFELKLKQTTISPQVVKQIDSTIPYPILFVVARNDSSEKYMISYKEPKVKNENNAKVEQIYECLWPIKNLEIKGNSVDKIYENLLLQIAPQLNIGGGNISQAIEINNERRKIQKQIDAVDNQIKRELQDNKRQELARKRYDLAKLLTQPTCSNRH